MKLQTTSPSNLSETAIKCKIIIERVSAWYDMTPKEIFQRRRFRPLIIARQELFYFLKTFCHKMSLASIGGLSSNYVKDIIFDHATVLHSINSVENYIFCDKMYNNGIRIKTNSLESEIKKAIGSITYEKTFTEKTNKLIDELAVLGETKEVDLLLMYLRKTRNERQESNTYSSQNHKMEMV